MKYILLILSFSILLSGEMEVDGDLKVTGTIQNDSLAQVILLQQQQILTLQGLIVQLQAQIALLESQMALVGGDLGYADCNGVVGGGAVIDDCGVCDGNNESMDVCGDCGGDAISEEDCTPTDFDGNTYDIVEIGDQTWMAENLKTTHYSNGDEIPTDYSNEEWDQLTISEIGAYAVYDDDPSNADIYGNLYNWYAGDDERGLCMEGWHLPSDEEWMELEIELGMDEVEANEFYSWRGTNQGSKLAGNADLWFDADLEFDVDFGTSGFIAIPAGTRSDGGYSYKNEQAYFWSSTPHATNGGQSNGRRFQYYQTQIYRDCWHRDRGLSVRCIKD